MSSHTKHGWAKASIQDECNNRYQRNAPLVVWCGRCRQVIPADEAWAKLAADGDSKQEEILLRKIAKWANKKIVVTGVSEDIRGRIELEFKEISDT